VRVRIRKEIYLKRVDKGGRGAPERVKYLAERGTKRGRGRNWGKKDRKGWEKKKKGKKKEKKIEVV